MKKSKTVNESKLIMNILMTQDHVNIFGKAHGGEILKLADEVAYVCACKHSGYQCVTASVDKVDFYNPINIGDLVAFEASVNFAGRTSMEIGVKITAENLLKGTKLHTNSCYITMVALDENGKPAPVPELILETEEETRRNQEAKLRRDYRLDGLYRKKKKSGT